MLKKGLIYVIVQFTCIFFLLKYGSLFKMGWWWMIQLIAIGIGVTSIFESRKGRFDIFPEVLNGSRLVSSGPYRYIRHPMYAAIILFFLPTVLVCNEIRIYLIYCVLVVDLFFKIQYEEKELINAYPEYKVYMQQTKRIIPGLI